MTDKEPLERGEVHRPEWGATVRWSAYGHYLDFRVCEGTRQDDGTIFYCHGTTGTEDFDAAERLVGGRIKWDGCSHLEFGAEGETSSRGDGYLHLCGARCFRSLSAILAAVFEIAAEKVPGFDAECAGLSDLRSTP